MKERIREQNFVSIKLSEKPELPVYQKETSMVFSKPCELIGKHHRSSEVSNYPLNFAAALTRWIL
jgi:hypothetical protein